MDHTLAQQEMMRLQVIRRSNDRTLPAPRLVEFRCRNKGHLLAVIYSTPRGPLAVSTADAALPPDAMPERNRQVRDFIADNPGIDFNPKRLGWRPSPRLIEVDEQFSDDPVALNCRCGSWPDLTRTHLRTALQTAGAPAVFGVSREGLHSAGGTLCMEFQ